MNVQPPVRVTHTFTQTLVGTPGEVLPLLCPVREAEWVPGWAPRLVLSASGVAEPDCVFLTPDVAAGPDAEAVWTILGIDESAGAVEMLKVTPGFLVVRLMIVLAAHDQGGCRAEVTYRYTALGPAGEAYVCERSAAAYEHFMRGWEEALNVYLRSRK
jgi:hypothetical protein